MDEDGFIFLVDRKKDVVISGGENIYPVQIEDFLHKHDDIKDVAVIGASGQAPGRDSRRHNRAEAGQGLHGSGYHEVLRHPSAV